MVTPKMITLYHQISLMSLNRQFQLRFRFIKTFHEFTNSSYEVRIKWITKKIKQLFKLKSNNPHPSCVIYQGVCVSEQTYIGETRHNIGLQWEEHENTSKDSQPANHLKENLIHKFFWKILFAASQNKRIRNENFINFNCNYVYIKYFNYHLNFCVSKSFYYSADDALLRKAFTDILSCCDIHFTFILVHMASLLNT